jgi:hypothetical protein
MASQVFSDQTWTLECRAAGEASWRVAVAATPEHLVTVPDLKPGTKYSFRSRTSESLLGLRALGFNLYPARRAPSTRCARARVSLISPQTGPYRGTLRPSIGYVRCEPLGSN